MNKIFTKPVMLTCVLLLAWIAVWEIILHNGHFPTWPVFLCMVSFFLAHQNTAEISKIIIGACVGELAVYFLAFHYLPAVDRSFTLQLVFILVFVGLIVLFQNTVPKVFNSYAFLFCMVGALGARADNLEPTIFKGLPIIVAWLVLTAVGGTIVVYGCVMIGKIVKSLCGKNEEAA